MGKLTKVRAHPSAPVPANIYGGGGVEKNHCLQPGEGGFKPESSKIKVSKCPLREGCLGGRGKALNV